MRCLIQLFKIKSRLTQIDCVHSATDVDADNIRNGFIHNCHGRSDRAARSRMDIRHDTDSASRREFVITHTADLLDGFLFNYICITDRCIDFSLNL